MDILYPLRRLHGLIVEGPDWLKKKREIRNRLAQCFQENSRTVLLVLTPEHGNIGDHALAVAALQLLTQMQVNVLEIPFSKLHSLYRQNLLSVMNGYPILIQGGGSIGTFWPDAQNMMEQILLKNPKSPIVMLPNTAYFKEDEQGRKAMERALQIFGRHKNLHVYLREQISYELLKDKLKNVKLMPDLVMSLRWTETGKNRQGCILCLRSDCEKTLPEEDIHRISQEAEALFGNRILKRDMVYEGAHIPISQHRKCVHEQMEIFSGAELVITDRLHGMVFAAITGTPCVVLDSKSPKIRGCYRWISHLPYVKFLENRALTDVWQEIMGENYTYDASCLDTYYKMLQEDLEAICF